MSIDDEIIDIGSGDSSFADYLLSIDYKYIIVLDISKTAIIRAKERLVRLIRYGNLVNFRCFRTLIASPL